MNLMLERSTFNAQKIIESQNQAQQKENESIKNVVEKPKSKKGIKARRRFLDSFRLQTVTVHHHLIERHS